MLRSLTFWQNNRNNQPYQQIGTVKGILLQWNGGGGGGLGPLSRAVSIDRSVDVKSVKAV